MASVAGFVVAGGMSRRMGQDKAFLELCGSSLLSRAIELVRTVTNEVRIVGSREKFARYSPVVEDVFVGQGPLAGIHAALKASRADLNLALAVDLPFVSPSFLDYLVTCAGESNSVATVPRCGGTFQPLCAVYRRGFADVAEKALLERKNKIDLLFATVPVTILEEAELSQRGFGPDMFYNVNTPEDLEKVKGLLAGDQKSRLNLT